MLAHAMVSQMFHPFKAALTLLASIQPPGLMALVMPQVIIPSLVRSVAVFTIVSLLLLYRTSMHVLLVTG